MTCGCNCRLRVGAVVMLAICLVLGATSSVSAQEALRGRFALHANFGYQVISDDLRQRIEFQAYGEDARLLATHDISGGAVFDLGGFIDVWRELSIGASYAQTTGVDTTTVTGTVPHPLVLANDRTITPQTLDLTREEQSTHIHLAWTIEVPIENLEVRVMGGPSYFSVTQGVVTGVSISEEGGAPFGTVSVDRIGSGNLVKNAWGAHVGVDVSYMLMPTIGVGGFVRFSRGNTSLPIDDTLAAGGLQSGGGVRFRF